MSSYVVREGDCIERMKTFAAASIDAIVTDPPYGLSFMGRSWDDLGGGRDEQAWHEAWAVEALRVLKPGGYLLAFGGTRTYHRLACAIEDAGFEIRDCLSWLYGSGFPKSHDVSKAIDRAAGVEREDEYDDAEGVTNNTAYGKGLGVAKLASNPVTDDAVRWQGWGTALKPSWEPIIMARKPLIGTVAENVLAHGTGGVNIDGCRIDAGGETWDARGMPDAQDGVTWGGVLNSRSSASHDDGRWPANTMLGHADDCADDECVADCPVRLLDEQAGDREGMAKQVLVRGAASGTSIGGGAALGTAAVHEPGVVGYGDFGGASRFFYTAKASSAERNAGLDGFDEQVGGALRMRADSHAQATGKAIERRNVHPTVKPIDLMRWLIRLVTPPDGIVLDPFMGSGTTGCAAVLEDVAFIGIEREPEYCEIARARIKFWSEMPPDLPVERALIANRARQRERDAGQTSIFDGV